MMIMFDLLFLSSRSQDSGHFPSFFSVCIRLDNFYWSLFTDCFAISVLLLSLLKLYFSVEQFPTVLLYIFYFFAEAFISIIISRVFTVASWSILYINCLKINIILCSRDKKELIPFAMAWMELESIMLSEISQAVRDKYHMISPLTGT